MDLDNFILHEAKSGIDSRELIEKFAWSEIFFTILSAEKNLPPGPVTTTGPLGMRLSMVKAAQGRLVMFFANRDDHRRGPKYGGIPLVKAIEMVQGMPDADGLMIQSSGEDWISMDKKMIAQVIRESGLTRRQPPSR